MLARALVALFVFGSLGCGSEDPEVASGVGGASAGDGGAGNGGAGGAAPGNGGSGAAGSAGADSGAAIGPCGAVVTSHVPSGATHVALCSELTYDTDPPSGGDHYPDWAAFTTYDFAVPQGFLVHSLEHGAVVLWYNCPEGCTDEVAQAQAFIDALPADPLCAGTSARRRAVLVPSPTLASRWAASSWGWTLTASCFDAAVVADFFTAHYGQGREALCNAGVVVTPTSCP